MSFCRPLTTRQKLAWACAVRRCRDLSGSARLVAAELVEHHNTDSGLLCPSVERLADVLGLAVRTVKGALRELLDAGWIARRLTGRAPLYRLERAEAFAEAAPAPAPAGVQTMHRRGAETSTAGVQKPDPKPLNQSLEKTEEAPPQSVAAPSPEAAVLLKRLRGALARCGGETVALWLGRAAATAEGGGLTLRPRCRVSRDVLARELAGGALASAGRMAGVRVALA